MITAECTEISILDSKVALFSIQYTGALLANHATAAIPQKVTVALNPTLQFLLVAVATHTHTHTHTHNKLHTSGTYPLVFTKLLSLVRCVPQREPVENYIFFQNFQLVKRHQHLHWLEKNNKALYKLFWDELTSKLQVCIQFTAPSSIFNRKQSLCFILILILKITVFPY